MVVYRNGCVQTSDNCLAVTQGHNSENQMNERLRYSWPLVSTEIIYTRRQ